MMNHFSNGWRARLFSVQKMRAVVCASVVCESFFLSLKKKKKKEILFVLLFNALTKKRVAWLYVVRFELSFDFFIKKCLSHFLAHIRDVRSDSVLLFRFQIISSNFFSVLFVTRCDNSLDCFVYVVLSLVR